VDFQRLRYFQTLSQTGHLRRSAELLRISPPALSRSMKILEDELEISLFIQDGRRLILTEQGQRLAKRVESLLEDISKLRDNLQTGKEENKSIRVATFEVFSTYFLSFLQPIGWADRKFQLHEVLPGELERCVAEGDVDFGVTYMPVAHPDLDFLKITSIEMGVFARQGAFPGVVQKDLPFVVPVQPLKGVPTRMRGLDGWPEDAYVRKIQFEVTLMESALELCRQGLVAGYFPVFIAKEHNQRVRPKFQLERRRSPYGGRVCVTDVYIVKRKSQGEDQNIKQMAKAIRKVCG
jgi:DNA-binding transcriptional LysR family regulator